MQSKLFSQNILFVFIFSLVSSFVSAQGYTVQELINNATNGDTISIPAGTYSEAIVIDKSLTLNGHGSVTLNVSGHPTGISIEQDVMDVTIDEITIEGDASTYSGITVSPGATNITLTNNTIRDILLLTGNPGNDSPLSYGILCWGNIDPININPPTNITISGTTISAEANSNMVKLNTVEYTVTVATKTSLHPYYNKG